MNASELSLRRAWSGTVTDGQFRDYFANTVAHRINDEHQAQMPMTWGEAELVEDFVARCDAIFAEHGPETAEAVARLAAEIELANLYEVVGG